MEDRVYVNVTSEDFYYEKIVASEHFDMLGFCQEALFQEPAFRTCVLILNNYAGPQKSASFQEFIEVFSVATGGATPFSEFSRPSDFTSSPAKFVRIKLADDRALRAIYNAIRKYEPVRPDFSRKDYIPFDYIDNFSS